MIILLVSLLGAEVDRGQDGAIVTIRPDQGEDACLLVQDRVIPLPNDAPKPMWLIDPLAWRNAIAKVEELSVYPPLILEHEQTIRKVEEERNIALQSWATEQDAHKVTNEQLRRARKQRWQLFGVGAGAGVVGTVVVGLVVAGALP